MGTTFQKRFTPKIDWSASVTQLCMTYVIADLHFVIHRSMFQDVSLVKQERLDLWAAEVSLFWRNISPAARYESWRSNV
ncbi:MAG: hypothetical protein ACPGLY_21190 [Rubripirellula sp.]